MTAQKSGGAPGKPVTPPEHAATTTAPVTLPMRRDVTKPTRAVSRRYLTVDDVVERYGGAWSRWQVYELARTSRVPHRKHSGSKRLLFLAADLDAWDDGAPLDARTLPAGGRIVVPAEVVRPSRRQAA